MNGTECRREPIAGAVAIDPRSRMRYFFIYFCGLAAKAFRLASEAK